MFNLNSNLKRTKNSCPAQSDHQRKKPCSSICLHIQEFSYWGSLFIFFLVGGGMGWWWWWDYIYHKTIHIRVLMDVNFGNIKAVCNSGKWLHSVSKPCFRDALLTYCFSWCRGTPSSPAYCPGALSWVHGNSVGSSRTGRRPTPYETASPASPTHTSSPETSITDIRNRNQ